MIRGKKFRGYKADHAIFAAGWLVLILIVAIGIAWGQW